MAAVIGDLPVAPEITKSIEVNPRRSSMGKAISSSSREKVLPHYLRASTGSCHDFCKYGRKHASEAKERPLLRKRITKSAPDNQSPTVTVIVPEKKKTFVVKPYPSTISKSSFEIPKAEIIKKEGSTKSLDGQNVNASSGGQNPIKSEVQSEMKKTSVANLRTSPKSNTRLSESPKFKTQEVSSSSEKVNVSSRKVSSKSKETFSSAKNATSIKLESPVMKPLLLPDHSGHLSGRRISDINSGKKMGHTKVAVKQAPTSPRLTLASPRASLSSKPSKVAVKKAPASPRLTLASPRASLSSKPSKVAVEKAPASLRLTLSPKPSIVRVASLNSRKPKSLKVVSPMKNQRKVKKAETEQSKNELQPANDDLVHEKTLYVIKMEIENKSLESDKNANGSVEPSPSPSPSPSSSLPKCIPTFPSSSLQIEDQEPSEYTETDAEDDCLSEFEYEESMSMKGGESLGGESNGKPKKDGMVHSEDKDSQAMKLHFRRGKFVDIQSESNSPKRLKFRRGRLLGQNQNLKPDGRRSFKKRGEDDGMNDSKPGSVRVVLRHQDVQGKKDSQILFNNVIEQTASKLVETRKSKVKALVGAFETVISLQDSKPSVNIFT